jgi:DNA polymerase elongation subunit (family B)
MKFQLIDISTLSSGHGRDAFLLWGRTAAGKAVSLRVSDFQPYVLVKRVPRESKEYLADVLRDMMKQEKKYWNRKKKEMDVFTVAGPWFEIEECKGRSVRDVSSESLKNGSDIFWKISTRGRRDIYTLKKTLRSKDFSTRTARGSDVETTLYNCNIPPALRWMLDCNIKPCYWISCEPESTYNGKLYQWIRSTKRTKTVRATACLGNCSWDRVACEYDNAVAPLILAVLDIETLPFESERSKEERLKDPTLSPVIEFRGPEHDQILQISLVSCRTNAMGSVEHTIFMIGEDETHIPEKYDDGDFQPSKATVRVFKEEKDMLVAFCHAIIALDPDILSGYNVTNFDMKYIWTRAELLMCKHALSWSRIFGYVCQMSKKIFKNRAFGSNELFVFDVPGRIVFDLYQHMKKAHKLSSYKLDTVAEKFLGTKKMPVSYADIPKLQETQEGRLEMAAYCLKDSWLVVRLIAHLCTMSNLTEMSRVCGITMNDVLSRGQMIRSLTNIYYYAKRHKPEYFLPEFLSKDKTKKTRLQYLGAGRNQSISLKRKTLEEEVDAPGFKGAVVITPKPGWYDENSFVTCLDFASLYPSIMRWKNMCYSTIVSPDVIEKNGLVEDVDYHRIRKVVVDDADNIQLPLPQARSDVCFLTAKRRLGILPVILETLLAARKRAKKDMKTATTEHSRKIANGRQLALKVVCNSLYGFTGTWYGYLPEQRIASSVTETGRNLALVTKKMCEENYAGCKCVYGDTDSVFIQVPKIQLSLKAQTDKMVAVHEVAALSEKMAAFCDKSYPNNADGVINLEFEKIYSPFLLLKKKRYVGYKYEEGKLKKPEIDFKGIELTRRDGCGLTKKWMRDILPMVFIKNDVAAARVYIESNLKGVYAGSLPIDIFVSSKQLSKKPSEYKNKPEHVVLAERLMKDPINRISIGDRIHFVIRAGFRGEKIRDRAVLPRDIEEGRCVLDLDYYTEKKLHIPLRGLLSHVIKDIDELFLSASMKAPRQRNFQKSRVGRMFAKKRRREDLIGEQARERKRKQVDAIMNSLQTDM